jgi:DNA-3-methyladenine glycosylase I
LAYVKAKYQLKFHEAGSGVIFAMLSVMQANSIIRCSWSETDTLFIPYHDNEWGVPVHDSRLLFEMLNLEGAQAGLSWLTILKKRQNYQEAFDNFNPVVVSQYDDSKRLALLTNPGIVRNRLKINAVIENAKAFLNVEEAFGSFDAYIWRFSDNKIIVGNDDLRAADISQLMSKDMKKQGFRFIGPTICYAFMQAVGIVNDHSKDCFRFALR